MLTLLLTLSDPAVAGPYHRPPRRPPPPPQPVQVIEAQNDVSMTVSVADLTQGVVDIGAEFRLGKKGGLRVDGGIGGYELGLLYKAGLAGRLYALGDFDTGLYLALGVEGGNHHQFLEPRTALTMGPSLGVKLTGARFPITVDVSGGADLVAAEGFLAVAPRLDMGLGFSF